MRMELNETSFGPGNLGAHEFSDHDNFTRDTATGSPNIRNILVGFLCCDPTQCQ